MIGREGGQVGAADQGDRRQGLRHGWVFPTQAGIARVEIGVAGDEVIGLVEGGGFPAAAGRHLPEEQAQQ